MNAPSFGGIQICQLCADKHVEHNPIVETAILLLGRAKEALEKNNRYNKGEISYPDYLCHGVQTAVDRVLEPLLRVKASRDYDQSADCLGYYALAIGYFLAGCPPSKITVPTNDIVNLMKKLNVEIHQALGVKSYCTKCHKDVTEIACNCDGDSPQMIPTLTMPTNEPDSSKPRIFWNGNEQHGFVSKLTGDVG